MKNKDVNVLTVLGDCFCSTSTEPRYCVNNHPRDQKIPSALVTSERFSYVMPYSNFIILSWTSPCTFLFFIIRYFKFKSQLIFLAYILCFLKSPYTPVYGTIFRSVSSICSRKTRFLWWKKMTFSQIKMSNLYSQFQNHSRQKDVSVSSHSHKISSWKLHDLIQFPSKLFNVLRTKNPVSRATLLTIDLFRLQFYLDIDC